jgi:thymidylate synthase ThyX
MTFAKVLLDSTSWTGKRITTFHLKYPRYVHSELMTHRVFSKNSGSSRAIPIEKMIQKVKDGPVQPLWTENQKGMQGPVITNEKIISGAEGIWTRARNKCIIAAEELNDIGIHKQNVNRLLEPWMFIEIVLTGTEFDNWFELRNHKDAQPEIRVLAELMKYAMDASTPEFLNEGEWHLPFIDDLSTEVLELFHAQDYHRRRKQYDETEGMRVNHFPAFRSMSEGDRMEYILKASVARCARVSYFNFDGGKSLEADIALFDKLITSRPLHASPAEHQARVPTEDEIHEHMGVQYVTGKSSSDGWKLHMQQKVGKYFSNLNGWIQLRKLIECGEFR